MHGEIDLHKILPFLDMQIYNFLSYIFSFLQIQLAMAIDNETVVNKTVKIYNVDRAVCGRIAGTIAKKYGDTGFAGQLNIT